MKRKDMVYLILAVGILLVAGYMAYNILFASKQKANAKVPEAEVVGLISPGMDNTTLSLMQNPNKTVDYDVDIDTRSGVGNPAVFGQ